MLLHTLLTIALLIATDIDAPPKYKAWIQDHEVWMQTDAGPRRVIYDALAEEPVAVSPSGDRVVYGVANPDFDAEHGANPPRQYIDLASTSGQFQRKISLEDALQSFDRFDWIDSHRIGAMVCGHANCIYWILDADTGKTLQKMMGGFDFLWSHDRHWVAHRHVAVTADDGDALMLNDDKIVYPLRDPGTGTLPKRDIGELAWSPDDKWVSFCETEYPSHDGYVVLYSPQGNFLRTLLPEGVQYSGKIEWTDSSHFQINTFGKGLGHVLIYKFVVDGGSLQQIAEPAK